MIRRIILHCGIFMLVARFADAQTTSAANVAAAAPPFRFTFDGGPAFDFGTVDDTGTISHQFVLQNTGRLPILIQSVRSPSGDLVVDFSTAPILAGKTGQIKVRYLTLGKSGAFRKSMPITLTGHISASRDTVWNGTLVISGSVRKG